MKCYYQFFNQSRKRLHWFHLKLIKYSFVINGNPRRIAWASLWQTDKLSSFFLFLSPPITTLEPTLKLPSGANPKPQPRWDLCSLYYRLVTSSPSRGCAATYWDSSSTWFEAPWAVSILKEELAQNENFQGLEHSFMRMTDTGTATCGWEPCLTSHHCLVHNLIKLPLG